MSEPDYICIHDPAAPTIHGKWFDVADWSPRPPDLDRLLPSDASVFTYVPTGMIDVRDDGAVAEVYMREGTP